MDIVMEEGLSVRRPQQRWEDDIRRDPLLPPPLLLRNKKKKKKNGVLRTATSLPGGRFVAYFNPLNAELNPICYLLALLAHYFLHVSGIRVKSLTLRLLMSYIYIWSAYS